LKDYTYKLIRGINAVESVDSLSQLLNTWYREISDSPTGMYDADNLKKRALQMLAVEESTGLRQAFSLYPDCNLVNTDCLQ